MTPRSDAVNYYQVHQSRHPEPPHVRRDHDAFDMIAPVRFAPVRFAPVRFAPRRFAPVRFAPVRFTPVRFTPVRFAPRRFARERFAREVHAGEVRAGEVRAAEVHAGAASILRFVMRYSLDLDLISSKPNRRATCRFLNRVNPDSPPIEAKWSFLLDGLG